MRMKQGVLFDSLEERSMAILLSHEPPEGYWLAFSGGKDSIVLHALAVKSGVKFDAHYSNTTCDPPDLIYFMRANYPKLVWEHPKKSIWDMIPERGFPMRQARWCCAEYKERGGSGRFVLTGIRAKESNKRAKRQMVETCYIDSTKIYVHPIIAWSEDEVWEYIRENDLPYCKLYDQGWKRIGCVICPFNRGITRDLERYPGYRKLLERSFEKLYARIGDGPTAGRWRSWQEMLEWWLDRDRSYKQYEDDTLSLFT